MSELTSIYAAIAAMTVTGATARDIGAIQVEVRPADMPVRMLLPSPTGELEFVGLGTLNKITWVIRDLCLWAPMSAGSGIADYSTAMVNYIKAYVIALKAERGPTAQSVITGVAFQMGPVPWGDSDYWAIDVTLTIDEIL